MTGTTRTETKSPYRKFEDRDEYLQPVWAADERSQAWAPSGEPETSGLINGRPISHRGLDTFEHPFPALTPAQRLHPEFHGYVVIENLLTPGEAEELRTELYDLERRVHADENLDALRPSYFPYQREDMFRIENVPHVSPSFFDYVTHPRIIGMANEAIGGPARYYSSHAHIRRPISDPELNSYTSHFHRGSNGLAGTITNGLYHFQFVHALTNLTDLGPDDGGTLVIAGSHKLPAELDMQAVIDAAKADPTLLHHVEAPAGSTLLFFESLIHASGTIRSGRDRLLIIGGYAPHFYQAVPGFQPAAELLRRLPEDYRRFFIGYYGGNWADPTLTARSLTDYPPA